MLTIMKRFFNIVVLNLFCLSFVAPVMPGLAVCVSENGHTEIVNTSDNSCCDHEEHAGTSDSALQDVAKNICTDIPLSFEAGSKRLSAENNTVIKAISSYSVLDTPAFARVTKIEKLVAAHSPPQDFSISIIQTTIILV